MRPYGKRKRTGLPSCEGLIYSLPLNLELHHVIHDYYSIFRQVDKGDANELLVVIAA